MTDDQIYDLAIECGASDTDMLETAVRTARAAIDALRDAPGEARAGAERMRVAQEGLLAVHTDSAGMTPEIVADDLAFAKFMVDCDQRVDAAVDAARAALLAVGGQG